MDLHPPNIVSYGEYQFDVYNEQDHLSSKLMDGKLHDEEIIDHLKNFCDPNKVIFDIGGCLGTFSIPLSKHCKQIYAYEPFISNYYKFCNSIRLNNIWNIQVFNCLVGSQDGFASLVTYDSYNFAGVSFKEANEGKNKVVSLDSEIERLQLSHSDISLVKIDVEGMEVKVLHGSEKLIKDSSIPIYMELHSPPHARGAAANANNFMMKNRWFRSKEFEEHQVLYEKRKR